MGIDLVIRPLAQRVTQALRSSVWRLRCNARGVKVAYGVSLSNVSCADYANIAHNAELSDVVLGKRTSVGRFTKIRNAELGAYCSISWNVTIGAVGHPLDHPSSHAFSYRSQFGIVEYDANGIIPQRVIIGNDVWIGCDAIIMPGVSIGNGAVIGAGAIVTKDVEPYAIVSGVPAKVMKYRFSQNIIEGLESLRWWEWDDQTLHARIHFFKNPLTEESLNNVSRGNQ